MTARLPALLQGYADAVPDIAVTGIEIDSRRVAPGALFLALRGHGKHGLAFIDEARSRGAVAVAWEPAAGITLGQSQLPAVEIKDLSGHAGAIAARFYRHPSRALFTVGITGTDGKTSIAHLVAQSFDRLGRACAYLGTLGYGRLGTLSEASHTTPDAVRLQALLADARDSGATACALEVSSHALDQRRVDGVDFNVAVLSNLGRDHLDYHLDLETYAAAKRRLFTWPGLQAAVLNRDDALGAGWALALGASQAVTVYGLDGVDHACSSQRYVLGIDLQAHRGGLSFAIRSSWGEARLTSRLLGRFNAYNLLAALAALLHAGVPLDEAVNALAQAETVPGRIEAFQGPRAAPLVVVDYAHTPQALTSVLAALRPHVAGRLICVFGCGGDRDRGKRPLMGAAAAAAADALILTDDNPRSEDPAAIVQEILAGIPRGAAAAVVVEHDRAIAIAKAVREAGPDDVVLIAGKGHEEFQVYGRERRPFSDRLLVADLLGLEARA